MAWFATLSAPDVVSGPGGPVAVLDGLQAVHEGAGMLALRGDDEVRLRVELADRVTLGPLCVDASAEPVPAPQVTLPPAPAYITGVDLQTNQIVGIDCAGRALGHRQVSSDHRRAARTS